jgi:hypothetical protein
MWDKLRDILSARWERLLFVFLAVFKSCEFASGLFEGWAAWVAESVTVLLFFGAYLIIELGPAPDSRNVARRIRIGLLVLLIVAVTWDALRAARPVVTNRMEHERLLRIHQEMVRTEEERLDSLYKGSGRLSGWCEASLADPVGPSHPECSELYRRRKEIAEFRLKRQEPSENTEELRKTLRARQLRLQELLLRYAQESKSLPEPVEFALSGRHYSYLEMMEWIGACPGKIEVQAVFARLMRNAFVLATAFIFTMSLKALVLGHPAGKDPIALAPHPSSATPRGTSTVLGQPAIPLELPVTHAQPARSGHSHRRSRERASRMTNRLARRVAARAPTQ